MWNKTPSDYNDSEVAFYEKISEIDAPRFFLYIIIILTAIFIGIKLNLSVPILLFFALFYVFYLHSKRVYNEKTYTQQLKQKLGDIQPQPMYINDYPIMIELFYSIQDLEPYNTEAYANIIYNVDSLIHLYQDVKVGVFDCKYQYDTAMDRKLEALNSLQAIIYKLDVNKLMTKKLHDAITALHKILDFFTEEIRNMCNKEVDQKGFIVDRAYVAKSYPLAANTYNDDYVNQSYPLSSNLSHTKERQELY